MRPKATTGWLARRGSTWVFGFGRFLSHRAQSLLGRVPRPDAEAGSTGELKSAFQTVVEALTLLAGIGLLDWYITSEISVSTLYLVPVGLVAWSMGKGGAVSMSFLAAFVWFLAEVIGRHTYSSHGGALWQALSRFCFFVVTGFLIDRIHTLTANLEELVQARTAALKAEVIRRKELEEEALEITSREQERIAQELHDELAAYLAGIAFRVKTLAESLDRHGVAEATDAQNLVGLVNHATDQVRGLARLLVPIEGAERDLAGELSRLGREVETVFGITCTIGIVNPLPPLTSAQCSELYRIAQEAVRNAVKHSKAELVQISVSSDETQLTLEVLCDGERWRPSSTPSRGLGLRIMHHRTERLGGSLTTGALEGGGALVTCKIPVAGGRPEAVASLGNPGGL